MKQRIVVCAMLALLGCNCVFAQQPSTSESHKNRTIFTIVGGAGGFAAGAFIGLSAFDDAVNSDRKVWTTALVSAAGGTVGGYFIGRALDKRSKGQITLTPDEFRLSLMRSQWPAAVTAPPDPFVYRPCVSLRSSLPTYGTSGSGTSRPGPVQRAYCS